MCESRRHRQRDLLPMVGRFGLRWRKAPDRSRHPLAVEPVRPVRRGQLHLLQALPRAAVDQQRLVRRADRLGQRVVAGIADSLMPTSASRRVQRIDTCCAPRSLSWTSRSAWVDACAAPAPARQARSTSSSGCAPLERTGDTERNSATYARIDVHSAAAFVRLHGLLRCRAPNRSIARLAQDAGYGRPARRGSPLGHPGVLRSAMGENGESPPASKGGSAPR